MSNAMKSDEMIDYVLGQVDGAPRRTGRGIAGWCRSQGEPRPVAALRQTSCFPAWS